MNREVCIDECLYIIYKAVTTINHLQKIRVRDIMSNRDYFDGYVISFLGFGGEDHRFDLRTLEGLKHHGHTAYIDKCGIPCISVDLVSIEPTKDYDISEEGKSEEEKEILRIIQEGINVLEKHKYIRGGD